MVVRWPAPRRGRSGCCGNVVHGSDSSESAAREIAIFFTDAELTG